MYRFFKGAMVAAVLVSLTTGSAQADQEASTSIGVGLSNFTVLDFHAMGIGANVSIPFRENRWAFSAGMTWDFSNYKEEDSSGPTTAEFEQKLSGYRLRAGVDRQIPVGPALFYCGTGLHYSSHKYEQKVTGSPDFESEPYSVFGLSNRTGSSIPLSGNPNIALYGQINNTVGFGSYEEGDFKLTQTDVTMGGEMGVRWVFPTRQ
jgi:hypothetical protein